ncbi:MAG: ATP-dependent helicase HrpB [Deltaproteobacteria bacterium]|nr:ATP-dependent helicase HrpB [Deltaproteobacteria bacterium]
MTTATKLPITPFLAEITGSLSSRGIAIVKAEPGAGKTTQLPRALLDAVRGRIVVLEPRRLAARLSAERIAQEMGEACGETVGYSIRFGSKQSGRTRVLFVTEGVFLRLLQDDPELRGVEAVVIDEFHERHLHTDLALAAVAALRQSRRADLKLVVMSATLDTRSLEQFLPGAAVFDIPGRTFPVTIDYLTGLENHPIEEQVVSATKRMTEDPRCQGDILVFLPGMQDIRRCAERLAQTLRDQVSPLPLAADLSPAEQARVFAPSAKRKVILATNVAETSLTIPGVTGVIDVGLAKIAGHAAWSGIATLDVKKISQAAAIQRSGRAGRMAPGVAYRLYSEGDFLGRQPFTAPDIRRLDLAEVFLTVQDLRDRSGLPVARFDVALPWFEAPMEAAVVSARQLLRQLGAITDTDQITIRGRSMARLPFHPRLSAIIVAGQEAGCGEAALAAATLISEGMVFKRGAQPAVRTDCDLRLQIDAVARLEAGARLAPATLAAAIDMGKVKHVVSVYRQLAGRLKLGDWPGPGLADDERLTKCLLAGFPDRVAKKRNLPQNSSRNQPPLYNFCLGRGGYLGESSTVRDASFILVFDASEAASRSADRGVMIFAASALSPAVLQDGTSTLVMHRTQPIWVDDGSRADVFEQVKYGELIVSEARLPASSHYAAQLEELLRAKLAEVWPKPFDDDSDLVSYHARLAWLVQAGEGEGFPTFDGEMLELLQAEICGGKRSFKDILERSLGSYIEEQLSYAQQEALRRGAPTELKLANGRRLKVHYELHRDPYISGFVQDFYGLTETPRLAGKTGLTVQVLGPNRRPLQVTGDLAGFWQRHYPALRAELGRKYPKHFWPEQPATAGPFLYYNQMLKGQRPESQ